jgi:cytochrome c biogenesis protein CcmG, thiol:disulfide interchange protein DsbE
MKNKGIILLVILIVAGLVAVMLGQKEKPAGVKAVAGQPAPDFELRDLQGNNVNLRDFRGKVVLVNFWATWCDTCRSEAPAIQKLVDDREFGASFQLLKILFRDTAGNAARYMKEKNFTFRVLVDDRQASVNFGVRAVPESFLISKNGILKYKFTGPVDWDSPDVRSALRALISEE